MRALPILSLAALLATPLAAQAKPADPDVKVAGGGVPAGWESRLDDPTASASNVKFAPMGGGFHFTTGPAGIYWRAADAVPGSFHTVATFVQTKAPMHPEAYGLFIAGSDLSGPNQSYIYFLVRGNGQYSIRQRKGATVTDVTSGARNGWTPNDAVAKKLTFKVNGKVVQEIDAPGGTVAGLVGIRMNHNLDVHIDGFGVHKTG